MNEILSKTFQEWEIENRIKFIVNDNGKDICNAVQKNNRVVQIRMSHRMDHLLNLMVQNELLPFNYIYLN